ncbi:TPA: hypothetical protein ACTXXA_003146 [Legionella anisa]
MDNRYELCRQNLTKLNNDFKTSTRQRNESTTRLHFIDFLFFECLNWPRQTTITEESYEGKYSDYNFKIENKCVLIVEAKKEGDYFELPIGICKIKFKIKNLLRDYPSLKKAMTQVADYCQHRGVKYGAISNGHQLIIFIASRNDSLPPLEGNALVFDSIECMEKNCLELWQYLYVEGINENKLYPKLVDTIDIKLPHKISAEIPNYPGIKKRNELQVDIKNISEWVLEDLMRHPSLEKQFLEQCYCKSDTLSQYSLISKKILAARYDVLLQNDSPEITFSKTVDKKGISKEVIAESHSRRPVLLIGDVGVGKSTFIKHLMKIEAANIIKNSIAIYIDLGSKGTLEHNFEDFIKSEMINQLLDEYDINIEEKNFVRGVYNREVEIFKSGIYSDYQKSNPNLFKEKEIEFLEQKIKNKSKHLQNSLIHIAKGRNKQIILFIDNADQRNYEVQENTFLLAQELAENWHLTVFISLRPETFYLSKQQGVLSGYHAKAFTISPPRIDSVIKKRLLFALKIANDEIPFPPDILEGVHLRLEKLKKLIQIFLRSLDHNKALLEFIDNICSGNVRNALDLVRNFFGSGYVNTENILRIYEERGEYKIHLHDFQRTVIYGEAEYYDPERSLISNLFDIDFPDPKEHFILPILLGFLNKNTNTKLGSHKGFIDLSLIYTRFQNLGYTIDQINFSIQRGLKKKLFEASNTQLNSNDNELKSLRITAVGTYHILRLCKNFIYIDAIVIDIPFLNPKIYGSIGEARDIQSRLKRATIFIEYLTTQWNKCIDSGTFDWSIIAKALNRNIDYIAKKSKINLTYNTKPD